MSEGQKKAASPEREATLCERLEQALAHMCEEKCRYNKPIMTDEEVEALIRDHCDTCPVNYII